MNKIYRIVWNKARVCLVVVGENAKGVVKSSGSGLSAGSAFARWCRDIAAALLLLQVSAPPFAQVQTVIKPDGRTQTTVGNSGAVYNVSTTTQTGSNAFNSFSAFSVGSGNTVNLYVPSSAVNLINIVRDQRTDVYGILNAIKDGRIGGNVWFANPNGFVVGASGVVNVGSLTVSTPTQQFVDGFFTAPGSPDPSSVTQLLSGTAPRNSAALVSVEGRINAAEGISLSAGAIKVAGTVYSGAHFVGSAPDFSDVVNANGLASATNVVVKEGRIQIVADNDVSVSGSIAAPGGAGVRGGDVSIRAGGNVDLNEGANVSVRGNGANSAGGTVNIWGDNNAYFHQGASIDASAGSSGDGGAIELSAKNTVTLAGGQFNAGAESGHAGSILIDPSGVNFSWNGAAFDQFTDGASYSVIASDFITLDNVYLSTRKVGASDANRANIESADSTGNSGSLLLQAPTITVSGGSKLLAQGSGAFAGGDVTLSATQSLLGAATVNVSGATIRGKDVTLTASSAYDDTLLSALLPIAVPNATATVDVESTRIAASGDLNVGATTTIKSTTSGLSPLGSITAVSTAAVDVGGASDLSSTGATKIAATSTVTTKATPGGPNFANLPGDAGAALNVVVSTATARVGGTTAVSTGAALEVSANNTVNATTKADATASGAVGVGGTVALSEVTSVTRAAIEDGATVTQAASLKVAAVSDNTVVTSAKASSKGAAKQTAAEAAASPSKSEAALTKYKDQATTSEGSVSVAAAVAIANVNSITEAALASNQQITSTGAAVVSSTASNASTVTADGSSASGGVGIGAAVGLNIGVLSNVARIADNSLVKAAGLTLSAIMPAGDKNSFATTATSGAGASNVGVAGALAVNVLVNTTAATLEGAGGGTGASVDASGGDVLVEAQNASLSTVSAGAAVKAATASEPAQVGVGASVGMNIAVNTTSAEIADGAMLTGAHNLGLNAAADHTTSTEVTGGAAGANVAVTPLAAVSVAVNTATARLGESTTVLGLSGAYSSKAEQTSSTSTVATGQTQGNSVAVGASIALTTATDTVSADIERDVTATNGASVEAQSTAKSSASATASVKGGEKAKDDGSAPAADGGSGSGQSVDQKVAAQGDAAKDTGKKTAASAAATPGAGGTASDKLDTAKPAPKSEETTQSGGVSVAAAVAVNTGVATTTAKVGKGKKITSSAGALKVASSNETDTSAKADGSQVDSGKTDVGVGAAVALNVGVSTNVAVIGDNADVQTQGLTVSAVNVAGQKSDALADAKSGAGAASVGVAGSLAVNTVVNTTVAALEGDVDNNGTGASVNAGAGDVLIEAANATTSTVKSGADVKGTDDKAKVGVGASLGMNVAVNTTAAEVADKTVLSAGDDLTLNATADHAMSTTVSGGAASARVAVTPLVAVSLAVNTTSARLGEAKPGDVGLGLSGAYSSTAKQTSTTSTEATGQTQGSSVAVGASIALTTVTDTVTADVERDIAAGKGVSLAAESSAMSSASATASVKGGEKAKDDGSAPAADGGSGSGQSVDDKVAAQNSKATTAGKTAAAKAPATTPAAGSSAADKLDATQPPPKTEDNSQGAGSVSVAAAVGVNVGVATTTAKIGKGRKISSTGGALKVSSANQTDTSAKADGSQVDSGNTDVGIGAAVALNVGISTNVATVGDDAQVNTQGLTISAVNVAGAKSDSLADAKSGAGAGNVGVAGALAANVVVNTTAAVLEGDTNANGTGASVNANGGDVLIEAGNATTSTVKSGADVKGTDDKAKVGVGASIGVNVGVNTTVAEVGDKSVMAGGKDFALNATADHTMSTEVSGGAAGAKVSVTPLVAVSLAVNTTSAQLGVAKTGDTGLGLSGAYSSKAEQTSSTSTVATGQTQGNSVAVGASIALTTATDTVSADIERDVTATNGVSIEAQSTAKSSASATASVKGGEKAKDDGSAPAADGGSGSGQSVDQKVAAQGDAARDTGKKTAASAAATPGAGGTASDKLDTTKAAPKSEDTTQSGGVSVAAAVGVNVGVATTTATVGKGRKITSSAGALKVSSSNETDTTAKADGSQVDSGKTDVGVGAAVALNVGISTNVATVGDDAQVNTQGLTVSAVNVKDAKSDSLADAKSGAGAASVGVAGSLAANVVVNTTVAALEGDTNANGAGASVNAGAGDVLIEAGNATTSTVKSGADVKGTDDTAKVGVGASLGLNIGVNTTVAAVADEVVLSGGKDLGLNATANHTMSTEVAGGAAGAKVSVTPLVAVSLAVNTTSAQLGVAKTGDTGLGLSGAYSSKAEQTSSTSTVATGQTQGNSVAVGASIALTTATDTVSADIERDVTATNGVSIEAQSTAKSSASATASVKGGEKAKDDGSAPAADGGSGSGQSVDDKVAAQNSKATAAGKATAAEAPATTTAAGGSASDKLDANKQTPPKGETSEGGVSVAAAVGVNVGVATTTAKVGKGRKINSSAGALKVASSNETDSSAKADGSQIDGGKTDVGVGAALALNVGTATTIAIVSDEAEIQTHGITVSATGISGQKSDSLADAKSGAGASNVGVAGSLAINAAVNTTSALIEGDADANGKVAKLDAGNGAVLIEAQNATTSTVKAAADVKMSGKDAKVGVGASVGVNVAVNTTSAEAADKTELITAAGMGLNATADHTMSTEVTGGAAGAKVSVTPVVAASIAVNTTTARLGDSAAALNLSGAYTSHAEQVSVVTTKATGQAQGDVAVGASLGATIEVDNVAATVDRNISTSTGIDLLAKSDTSLTTEVTAGAKGAKAAKKDADGNETPEKGTTVDEQKKSQLDFAKSRNAGAASVSTDTPEAKTPDTSSQTPGTDKPTSPPSKEQQGKKVSVAAAIGATVAYNDAKAEIAAGKTVNAGTGKLKVAAQTDTNYRTLATGEAVSDDIGIAAAVALTATYNKTQATLGAGATVTQAGDIEISAISTQNRGADFQKTMSAEAVSGASGGEVAVGGALAAVGNYNETRASIDEGVTIGGVGAPVGDVSVTSDETSKISAQARAGALSTGDKSKAGVGASFAVLLSYNQNTAAVGYDADANGSYAPTSIYADSLTVSATKNRVRFLTPTLDDVKNFSVDDIKNLDFSALDPSNYLGSNNYYTEAIAGAAAKGNAAVAGAFAIDVFGNTTEASLGNNVTVIASGKQAAGDQLGVEVSAHADTQAISFSGAVAGAKKAGVGISNSDIVNLEQTLAGIGDNSVVKATASGAGIKVAAYDRQDIANVSVSAGAASEGAGVAGVLGVIVSLAKTEAMIGDNAEVKSQGDVNVTATGDITAVLVSGGIGAGKDAGVGAAIAANVLANSTYAQIGAGTQVTAKGNLNVAADADETAVTAVVAGAGGEKAGVAGAVSLNVILSDTEAVIGQGAQLNTDALYSGNAQSVAITARDDSVIVGIAGGGAGGGKAGVGAAIDTTVLVKAVKAYIADDTDGLNVATVNADKNVVIDATSTETIASVSMGFAGGGTAGVGGAVSVVVDKNDVQAGIGKSAVVDSDGNVLVNAQDDATAVLVAGAGAGGGNAGVGGSLAVAVLLENSKAYIGDNAKVNARGNADAATVYSGDTVFSDTDSSPGAFLARNTELAKGLSVTAYNRENLITTVVAGAGGGSAGVGATVSANVIASGAEAAIGSGAKINENNGAASAEQQVRVKAVDETLLIDTAAVAAGGGSAGIAGSANVAVVAKTTTAKIGKSALVNAKKAIELDAASSDVVVSVTAGFAGGGSAGVGGAIGAAAVANTTQAYVEDGTSTADAAKLNVSGGNLEVAADEFSSSWQATATIAGGGAAGVGGALSVGVNASTTKARIGDYAETNASGTTSVDANSTENVNTVTVAGAGGGSAGVAGSITVDVIVAKTEAGIGKHAQVNQNAAYAAAGQNVDVAATDRIISVAAAGSGAGGGAAGVGGAAAVTVALNTTSAYIDNDAKVSAAQDVSVVASSEKYVNSATIAGAGGGAAGVAGAVSVLSVGSLLDGEANSGLTAKNDDGSQGATTQGQADGATTKSQVGDQLGTSSGATQAKTSLDAKSSKLAVSGAMAKDTAIPLKNTQAFVGVNATVKAGRDLTVSASDTTLAINASGAGAGGGAAGIAGSLGVVLLHDSAEAFIADGAKADAARTLSVNAETGETVVNIGVTGYGGGAAGVGGSGSINVVSSTTSAYIGDADINQATAVDSGRSVDVTAASSSNLITVSGSGGGAGAAAVGGIINVNTLLKTTKAFIGEGATVSADKDVLVKATSAQNIVAAGISIQGAGAAAVGGAATVNLVDNDTEAYIGSAWTDASKVAASVDSSGNVVVAASDDTLMIGVTGTGTGAGAAAVNGAVAANVVISTTRAYVGDNSAVNARGNAAGTSVDTGTISSTAGAAPSLPAGVSGDIDADRDGTKDGNVSNGASFTMQGGSTSSALDPSAAKDSQGNAIGGAGGGLGAKGTETAHGLSVTATGNEKVVTAALGIAGAGAAGVTGTATADVIASVTEARIGDGAQINQSGAAGSDSSVRVRAADNSLVVMASGTVAGAAGAGISGSANAAIIAKQTDATIGDADVKAKDVVVQAAARDNAYVIDANVSFGIAGVGGAAGVAVVSNETLAGVEAGATINATGGIAVGAIQNTAVDIYTVAGSAGAAAFSGAFSIGVIDNTTRAYVEDGSSAATAATLDAGGRTEIAANSSESITTATVSAAGGGVGVAGAVGVKVVTSETTAAIGDYTKVNQTTRGGAAQDVAVSATDAVHLAGGGGSAAIGAGFGAGATAEVNVVRNTTTASIGDSARVHADGDIGVSAASTKDVQAAALALGGGGSVGIAGAVSLAFVGTSIASDSDAQSGIGDGATASSADSTMKKDGVSGQLGSSEHVQGAKSEIGTRSATLGVASDLNDTTTSSQDKTRAYIGSQATIVAGDSVGVTASDQTQINLHAVGAAGGFVGIGGAIGVGITNSTTEAFIDASTTVNATGVVTVAATAGNIGAGGYSNVLSAAGAGGVVGLSAAVAVLDDASTTRAYLGNSVDVQDATLLTVSANTDREARTETIGVSVGGLAVGASVSLASFTGTTTAYFGDSVKARVDDLVLTAGDDSTAVAKATAGAAGILSGSGADASATLDSKVSAYTGQDADIVANNDVSITATSTASADAQAIGVSAGAAAVGVSLSSAKLTSTVLAALGDSGEVSAKHLNITARRALPAGGVAANASSSGSSGGLIGINGTLAEATFGGSTTSSIGANSSVTGSLALLAETDSKQVAAASGRAGGLLALGANVADAESDSTTHATLGDNVNIAGDINTGSISVRALGADANIASALAGVGGIVAGSAASTTTSEHSDTLAEIGKSTCGDASATCGMVAGSFTLIAQHDSIYNARVDSTTAALAGASGSVTEHDVRSAVKASVGEGVKVTANNVAIGADNASHKFWWGQSTADDSTATADNADWNVDAGAGGLFSLPAASTAATIRQATEVDIGSGALFHVIMPGLTTGSFALDASNTIVAYDKVKVDSGGAIALAEAKSVVDVKQNDAKVSIGSNAVITSDSGDINIGSHADVKLDVRAAANAYGLAGAPSGDAYATYVGDSTTEIKAGVLILATDPNHGAINVSAGDASNGQASSIVADTAVNLWNKTLVPIDSIPDAKTVVDQRASLTLDAGSNLLAAGDIGLAADRGAINVSAVGIGKDLYREAAAAIASAFGVDASFDITGGSVLQTKEAALVTVNGTVLSGLLRQSATQVDVEIINPSSDPDVIPSWRLVYSTVDNRSTSGLAANPLDASKANLFITSVSTATTPAVIETDVAPNSQLQARINTLYALQAQYASDPVASAAYAAEIKFLSNKLGPQGVGENSSAVTPRASAAIDVAGAANDVLSTKQALITGNVNGPDRATQIGAVGSLVDAYVSIDANNGVIDTALTAMKNADVTDAAYVALGGDRTRAGTAYGNMRTQTAAIGNYGYSCEVPCTAPSGPLGTLSSTLQSGFRIVAGSGYLGAIQDDLSNISLLALKQSGSSGSLVSNITDLSTQMNHIKTANAGIGTAASDIYSNLNDASTRQGTLSTNWRDTASTDNVDTANVATVTTRTALNSPLITSFDDTTANTAASAIKTNAAAVDTAATAAANGIATVTAASDTVTPGSEKLITLPDISVKLGNVNIKGDILAGTGSVQAPGDAKIWILNNAPASMDIGNLTVDSSGGNVRLNGFLVNSESDVRRFNPSYSGAIPTIVSRENGAAGAPEIRIVSNYDPSAYSASASETAQQIPAPAPDITLGYIVNASDPVKHISNPNGSVSVTSAAGDIYVDGTITAGSVSILARNGDFVQKYVNGFSSMAGEPNLNVQGGPGVLAPNTDAAPGAGIVANGSIFLSARYLNINGLVQSGIVNYHLDIPTDADLRFVLPQNLWAAYIAQCGGATCTINLSGGRSVTYDKSWIGLDNSVGRVVGNKAFIDQSVGAPVDVAVTTNGTRDYSAIDATYDPATQIITMKSNVAVRGGNIELFGQIINTASGSGSAGTGKLAVLDGFGQIAVNNQSSLAVVLKSIDAGVDPDPAHPGRGTVGTIDITDVQYIGAAGDQNLYAIHSVISRDQNAITVNQTGLWNADGTFCRTCTTTSYGTDQNSASRVTVSDARDGAYDPQAGLRYVYTTGKKTSTEYTWTFSGYSFFGTSSLSLPPDNISKTLTSGPNVLSNVNLADGTYLSYLAPGGTTAHQNNLAKDAAVNPAVNGGTTVSSSAGYASLAKSYTNSDVYNKIREWNTCNWWTLCISSRYTSIWTQTVGTTTITTNSVKADYPIQIEFLGANTAGINITSPNAALSLFGGSTLSNRYGDTSITAKAIGAGAGSLIDTRNATLTALNGSVGAFGAPVNLLLSGVLTASATNGNVAVNEIAGPLKVATVSATGDATAGQGKVLLTAQDDIYGDAGNLISGERIELESETGDIGGIAGHSGAHLPLNLAPGYTADRTQQQNYGVKASAAGDIGIDVQASAGRNPDGNLLADTIVSAGGDVRLTAPGQILDNNPVQSIDSRVWGDLINYWDKLGLVGGDASNTAKLGQAIVSYENGRTQDYAQYWQIRNSQNPPAAFDASWSYKASAAERSALQARGQSVADFEKSRTDRYWALASEVKGFDANAYARSADAAKLRQAHPGWTQAQVDAQVVSDEKNGLLPAAGASAGYDAGFTYVATQSERDPYLSTGSWTTAQLALSLNPGLLKDITDTNPVIKAPNVSGRNVTLVAGNSIGTTLPSSDPTAVFIPYDTDGNISDAAKIALATAEYNDFILGVTQGGKLGLRIEQRLPFNFSASTGISATVRQGGIAGNALTPHLYATDSGNAYLASLGDGIINAIVIDGELRFKVKGPITALNPTLVAIEAGDAVLESANATIGADAAAVLPLKVRLVQDSGATADSYGSITARAAGAVNISASDDVTVGGIFSRQAITLASEAGSILDAHPNTGLDILGGTVQLIAPLGSIGDINADRPLSVGTNIGTPLTGLIEAQAGDSIYLNGPAGGPVGSNFTIGPVVAGHAALSAGNAIRISATGDALINGDVIAAGPVEFSIGKKLTLSAQRDIEIADPAAPDKTITVSTPTAHVSATAVGVTISADELLMEPGTTIALNTGGIAIATQGNATLTGIEIGAAPGNTVSMSSAGGRMTVASLTGLGGGYTDNLNLTLSAPGGFTFDSLWAAHADVRVPLGSLRINETRILDRATFTNPLTLVLVDQHDKRMQKADIQLYSGGDPFSMFLDANHLETTAFIIQRGPLFDVVTPDGVNESVDEQGSNALARIDQSQPGHNDGEEKSTSDLVSFTGVPVSLE